MFIRGYSIAMRDNAIALKARAVSRSCGPVVVGNCIAQTRLSALVLVVETTSTKRK